MKNQTSLQSDFITFVKIYTIETYVFTHVHKIKTLENLFALATTVILQKLFYYFFFSYSIHNNIYIT